MLNHQRFRSNKLYVWIFQMVLTIFRKNRKSIKNRNICSPCPYESYKQTAFEYIFITSGDLATGKSSTGHPVQCERLNAL